MYEWRLQILEINQQKISYFQKRSDFNSELLDEVINNIEDIKNKINGNCLSLSSLNLLPKKSLCAFFD